MALKQVQHSRREALIEYERRVAKLQELDKMLAKLSVAHGEQESTPVVQARSSRRVMHAPHPSPLAETPMRTGQTMPVQTMHCRNKWADPTSSECGTGVRPSFTAAELQAARAEAWAERMAASQVAIAASQAASQAASTGAVDLDAHTDATIRELMEDAFGPPDGPSGGTK